MKIYTKIVMNIDTLEVIEEESYEYDGPLALCGGGSGGGSSSGEVDYPNYIKQIHGNWLAGGDYDNLLSLNELGTGKDLTSLLNANIDNSPYLGKSAYNPSGDISTMNTSNNNAKIAVHGYIDAYEDYVNSLDTTDRIETELAGYDAAMRDINAVGSSAFIIGRQIIASSLIEIKLAAKSEIVKLRVNAEDKINMNTIEISKLAIIAYKEQIDKDLAIDHQDAIWDFEIFQKSAAIVASIAGGTVGKGIEGPSQMQSAIGAGLAGAAAGAMIGTAIGGPVGAAAGAKWGAGIGGAVGVGSSFL